MKYKSELSENIIIGALINDINLILEMKDLKTEYFTIKVNKMLYVIIKRLFKAGSDSIDISDIVAITAFVGNSEKNKFNSDQKIINGDVYNSGDGLTANDALMIQQYLANIITEL